MAEAVSLLRLHVMRASYLLNCVLVGSGVCCEFVHRQKPWDAITGGGIQLLGGTGAPVGGRNPLPGRDAADHFHAAVLQAALVHLGLLSVAGGWSLNRACPRFLDRNRIGHCRDPLEIRICALDQEHRQ